MILRPGRRLPVIVFGETTCRPDLCQPNGALAKRCIWAQDFGTVATSYLVSMICDLVGGRDLIGLDKAPKQTLVELHKQIESLKITDN